MFAVRGLVGIVPLIGWAPLHPPEATQDCALVAFHCKVVAVPLGTLVLFATSVTVGFAVPLGSAVVAVLPVEGLVCVSADDSPQAASAASAAHPIAQRNTRQTSAECDVRRLLLSWLLRPVFEDVFDPRRWVRPTKLIRRLRYNLP